MLHIRVVSPPEETSRLTERLRADGDVVNLVVLPGSVLATGGAVRQDAVQFDVSRSAANAVLTQLRELDLDDAGPIAVQQVEAAIGEPEARHPWRLPSRGEHAPVWDLIDARIAADARYPPSFFLLLVFAGLIGACGILTNSQILIVGAMVVGPEYSAIISVAYGIERRDAGAVVRGIAVLVVGFLAAIAVTLLFALFIRGIGHTPEQYREGFRPVSDLINSPNLFSVVVAVVAALVGVVSLTLARAGALIGVFISVTTIPAAADIAVSAAFGAWPEARGSALQLLLNVGLLITVGAAALRVQRHIWRRG